MCRGQSTSLSIVYFVLSSVSLDPLTNSFLFNKLMLTLMLYASIVLPDCDHISLYFSIHSLRYSFFKYSLYQLIIQCVRISVRINWITSYDAETTLYAVYMLALVSLTTPSHTLTSENFSPISFSSIQNLCTFSMRSFASSLYLYTSYDIFLMCFFRTGSFIIKHLFELEL